MDRSCTGASQLDFGGTKTFASLSSSFSVFLSKQSASRIKLSGPVLSGVLSCPILLGKPWENIGKRWGTLEIRTGGRFISASLKSSTLAAAPARAAKDWRCRCQLLWLRRIRKHPNARRASAKVSPLRCEKSRQRHPLGTLR